MSGEQSELDQLRAENYDLKFKMTHIGHVVRGLIAMLEMIDTTTHLSFSADLRRDSVTE